MLTFFFVVVVQSAIRTQGVTLVMEFAERRATMRSMKRMRIIIATMATGAPVLVTASAAHCAVSLVAPLDRDP